MGAGVDVARTGAAPTADPVHTGTPCGRGAHRSRTPRFAPDSSAPSRRSWPVRGLPGEKGSLSPLHPDNVPESIVCSISIWSPEYRKEPRCRAPRRRASIWPAPARFGARPPPPAMGGPGYKAGIGAPYGRPPPAMGGPGPADPNDLPPLAAGAETAPRGDLGGRPGRRPVHARSTTAIGPGRGDTRGAGPAARPSRYGRRSALRQDAGCAPVEDRSPVTNSTSGGRLPAPSHDDRRTTPSGERARPQGHGRGRPPGSAPSRPRRPQDAAHAASQRPYPLSGPVV